MSGTRRVRPSFGGAQILYWLLIACGGSSPEGDPFASGTAVTLPDTAADEDGGDDDHDSHDDGESSEDGGNDDAPPNDAGDDGSGSGSDSSGGVIDEGPFGACAEPVPAGAPTAPPPPAYSGGACPAISPGYVTGFMSGGRARSFAFAVPSNYDPTKKYPLVIGWYHLSGDAQSFLDEIGSQGIADETQTIYAIPEATGDFKFTWPSTPFDNGSAGVDLAMFDDMLACISEQYSINANCVGSAGVSAGGLWTSYLGQQRGQYLSANVVISGGHPSDTGWWGWSSSAHRYPALVLWGGPSDELVISFHQASLHLIDEYRGDGHFVVRCEHTGGHGAPPSDDGGEPPYDVLIDFFLNHPYWLADGESPYAAGLPAEFPSYCSL